MNRVAIGSSLTVLGIFAVVFPLVVPLPGAGGPVMSAIGALLAIVGFIVVLRAWQEQQARDMED